MNLRDLAEEHGSVVRYWDEDAIREGIAALFVEDESWLCDAFDSFTPSQFRRMCQALTEYNTAARLTQLGQVLDELFTAQSLRDAIQRRIDELPWGGNEDYLYEAARDAHA